MTDKERTSTPPPPPPKETPKRSPAPATQRPIYEERAIKTVIGDSGREVRDTSVMERRPIPPAPPPDESNE